MLWGGYEENFRIFKWIFQRVDGQRDSADARKTPIGYVSISFYNLLFILFSCLISGFLFYY